MKSLVTLLVASALFASAARAEEQTISVPNEGWHIRFDAPKLSPEKGIVPSIFFGRADRLQISFFVEPPRCPGGDSDENIYHCFAESLRKNPVVRWDTERANTREGGGVMVMYMTRMTTEAGTGSAFNINVLFAHHGKWADFHTSIASPQKEEVTKLADIVNSLAIIDDEPAKETPTSK